MTNLFALLLVGGLVLVWLDGARAREFATTLARRYCQNRGLQLLDETVSLVRMGIRWTDKGLRIRRMFRFEFSLEGVGRRVGYVLMLGTQLESIDDGLPHIIEGEAEVETETPAAQPDGERKVIPFRRKER